MIVIPYKGYYRERRWVIHAIGYACLVNLAMRMMFADDLLPPRFVRLESHATILVCVLLGVVPTLCMYRHVRGWQFVGFAAIFCFFTGLINFLLVACAIGIDESNMFEELWPRLDALATNSVFVYPHYLLGSNFVGLALGWLVQRIRLGKAVLQDGTLCPRCAYSIVGCSSQRCPECGSAFSADDLTSARWTRDGS